MILVLFESVYKFIVDYSLLVLMIIPIHLVANSHFCYLRCLKNCVKMALAFKVYYYLLISEWQQLTGRETRNCFWSKIKKCCICLYRLGNQYISVCKL